MENKEILHWRTAMETPYLSGDELELGKEYLLEISKVTTDNEVYDTKERKKTKKVAIHFKNAKKPMILTKIKAKNISMVLKTPNMMQWIGKTITIYSKLETHFGQEFPVINVKNK